MADRMLSVRALNRALLARQLLLRRSRLSLVKAVERVGGLQAQYAPSPYIRLWSCLERFALADLDRALERKRLVQATLLRSTIHVVSAADYWPFADGLRSSRRAWWERTHARHVGGLDVRAAARAVAAAIGDGVRHRDELLEICRTFEPSHPTLVWNGLPLDLVRVPPSGTWKRRRADLYATAEAWLGSSGSTEQEGRQLLLHRYLAGFGPAQLSEAASWAGVPVAALEPAAERLRLRTFRDGEGKLLLDVPRAALPDEDEPAPVRFLPTWDATLLVHARRTQILPERFRPLVFNTKTPHSVQTFTVEGAVAGTWRVERSARRATLLFHPFEPLPPGEVRAVRDEGERLVRFVEPDAASHAVRRS
jgi:Winged helix DNA-binding domain